MKIRQYVIDAFATGPFTGNPAAVCLLNVWLPDQLMQNIAFENNLAETAFIVKEKEGFRIRWFTPAVEVDLCGHATLASAHAIYEFTDFKEEVIHFQSRSGLLTVKKVNGLLSLNFPTDELKISTLPEESIATIGGSPKEIYKGKTDYLIIYDTQADIEKMSPDLRGVAKIQARGVIITAPGKNHDFVSRFFGPQCGVDEDPVTGSAHTTLIPYWSKRLNKTEMKAKQLSKRGGELFCKHLGDRVEIAGKAFTFLKGEIEV